MIGTLVLILLILLWLVLALSIWIVAHYLPWLIVAAAILFCIWMRREVRSTLRRPRQ